MANSDYNKIILEGRFVKTPDLHYTKNTNMAIAHGTLATNKVYTMKNGEEKTETMFTDVEIFGKQAELAGQKFTKGLRVIAEGHLRQDVWESQDGRKNSKHIFVIERFAFIDFAKLNNNSRQNNNNSYGNDEPMY